MEDASAANPKAVAEATAGASANEPQLTFSLSVKKTQGKSLGIDVTYSQAAVWTRNGLFITKVFADGIVAAWNETSEAPRHVCQGDFIFQVNEVHGDTVAMIQEMKVKKTLNIHILRRPNVPLAGPGQAREGQPPGAGTNGNEQVMLERLQQRLAGIDDNQLVDFLVSVLERRPNIQQAVMGDTDSALAESNVDEEENEAVRDSNAETIEAAVTEVEEKVEQNGTDNNAEEVQAVAEEPEDTTAFAQEELAEEEAIAEEQENVSETEEKEAAPAVAQEDVEDEDEEEEEDWEKMAG